MIDKYTTIINNMQRLAILRDLALIDRKREVIFDRFTEFASAALGVPVSEVSMVASDFQYFKSSVGIPEPWNSRRHLPLSHSICLHVVGTGKALIANDARENELIKTNPAVTDFQVKSYLGVPLSSGRHNLGSFCVLDMETHEWTAEEIELVEILAALVNLEIDARAVAHKQGKLKAHIEASDARFKTLFDRMEPHMPKAELIAIAREFQQQLQAEAV
jgi:GAF domain-containing protein